MKYPTRLAPALVFLAALACSSPDPDPNDPDGSVPTVPGEPLSEDERVDVGPLLSGADRKIVHQIPAAHLDPEDVDMENDVIVEILDAEDARLGWLRDVFTHVSCSGVCQAVHFVLLFDADVGFLAVYNPTGTQHGFMKYWEGEYTAFTEADRAVLTAVLEDPPQSLIDVDDSQTLVMEATITAATDPAYHDVVVRGAAFTTHTVLRYMLETQRYVRDALIGGAP